MRQCCVPGCRTNTNRLLPYVSVFMFPKNPEISKLWLENIGRPLMVINPNTVVCVKHFEKDVIICKNNDAVRKRLMLKKGAVPTIFQNEDADSYSQSLDYSEELYDNMKIKDPRSISISDVSKESDDEFMDSQVSEQSDLPTTTDKPFIEIVKLDTSKEALTADEVFDDTSPLKSSPVSKPSSASKSPSSNKPKTSLPSPYKHLQPVTVLLKPEDRVNVQRELLKSNKRSLSTGSNSSVGNTETSRQQPKRRKIEKPPPTVLGAANDGYCWVCHREHVVLNCLACPRAYHQKCAGEIGSSSDWVCPECRRTLTAENVDSRSSVLSEISLDKLCTLLRFSLNKMKHRAGVAFLQPVSLEHYPMYLHYVIHPMDFSLLEKNIKEKRYGCTEAFLSDVKWILHNSCVFNGSQHPLSTNAKSIVKACDNDMQEIEVCPDCFMHNIVRNKYWFSEVCQKPHPLVWAKLKGFPYWPAKVVRIADGNVDARFFGAHDRAWVPISQCYHLSKEMPTSSKPKKKGNYETALDELNVHVQLLIQKYGTFQYAPYRTVFDPENKQFAYHGINMDLAAKNEVQTDIASIESTLLKEAEARSVDTEEIADSKDADDVQVVSEPASKPTLPFDNLPFPERESEKLPEKDMSSVPGQSSSSKSSSPSRSELLHRKKIEMALQRIKGYVTNDLDDEEKDSVKDGDEESHADKVDSEKDSSDNKVSSVEKADVLDSLKPSQETDSERKESSLDVPASKGEDSNDKDDKEEDMCLADLIKARALPPSDLPTLEDIPHQETPVVLEPSKKSDSFSLKLLETIESCKAKLGISSDLEKSDSDSEEEEDDEDVEEEEEEDSDMEDGDAEDKEKLAANGDSTEEDASEESSSDGEEEDAESSNTDIEMAEEPGVEKPSEEDPLGGACSSSVTETADKEVLETVEKVPETIEKEVQGVPEKDALSTCITDVHGASIAPGTSESKAIAKDNDLNTESVNVSEKTSLELVDSEIAPSVENKDTSKSASVSDCDNENISIPNDIELDVQPSPVSRSRSVSSNALQTSTDELTDTDLQIGAIEVHGNSEQDKEPIKTDTEPAIELPPSDKPPEEEEMIDEDLFICPPVRPPTPLLICLDDGTETDPEPEDKDNKSNKTKPPTPGPLSTKLPPPEAKICPENTEKYMSILKKAKLIPQNARKTAVKRQLKSATSEDSSDEETVTRPTKVPMTGAIRTFNRERSNAVSPQVNTYNEHQLPVTPSEMNLRSASTPTALQRNSDLTSVEGHDEEEIAVNVSVSDLTKKDAEILRLKKKLSCIYSAFQLQQWKSAQEKKELRHNMNLIIMEMRASLEADKKQTVDNITRTLTKEKQEGIEEAKKKQWCAFCRMESRYACCWNTSYCTVTCQKRHFNDHRHSCTQLKPKLNVLEGNSAPNPADKKLIFLNIMPKKDTTPSLDPSSQEKATSQAVSSQTVPSILPSVNLVSTPGSQTSPSVQFMLTNLKPSNSPTAVLQNPSTSKADSSGTTEPSTTAESNTDTDDPKNNQQTSTTDNPKVKKELSLEEIYFPCPPTICFEGLDTALPDESVHFEDYSESLASDSELTIAEESSAEEDMLFSDNEDMDQEMVRIYRDVEIKAKYLNKCLIYGKDAKKLTRCLVDVIFSDDLLAMCSAFGNKSNVTKMTRAALPHYKVEAIIDYVLKRFPGTSRSEITLAINMKCKEARVLAARIESGIKCSRTRTTFKRLLGKEKQENVEDQQKDAKPDTNNPPAPEPTRHKPTTVNLFKTCNPSPGIVRLQSPSATVASTILTTSTTMRDYQPTNIRQILMQPKYTATANPPGPNKMMIARLNSKPQSPTLAVPKSKTRSATVRSLLGMQREPPGPRKLVLPLGMLQKAVVAKPPVSSATAPQRPLFLIGPSGQLAAGPASQKLLSIASKK